MPRLIFSIIAAGLFLTPSVAGAQDKQQASDEEKLPGPKIAWPAVEGLGKQKVNVFKDKDLGYSVAYYGDKTSLTATAYVYNLGRAKIPTDADSDAVKAEMLDSLNALEANKTNGWYKTLSPLGETLVSPAGKGGPVFRRKRYEADIAKEGEGITELYLTTYKNYFIKLRTTYLNADKAEAEKQIAKLLESLAGELK